MYCQKCGLKLPEDAKACDVCGHPVRREWGLYVFFLGFYFVLIMLIAYLVGNQGTATAVTQPVSPAVPNQPQAAVDQPMPKDQPQTTAANSIEEIAAQVNPPEGYQLPAVYGDLGPRLLEAGAIDYDRFVQTYQRAGQPLNDAQLAILTKGSDEPILMSQENAYFLLNFFWAVGLTNQNPILLEGMMVQASNGEIGRYASTGGWTIGQKPATELYASKPLIALTPEQQRLVESVAERVYRPCCNNHTAFPDCNHGMAMLGLLELMAAQGANEDELFAAAKYINAFWFPQQALETAVFFKATLELDYADVDGRMAVGPEVFSATGFQQMRQWLAEGGNLPQGQQSGNSCGT